MIRLYRFSKQSGTYQVPDITTERRKFRLCRFWMEVRAGFSQIAGTAPHKGSPFLTPLKRNRGNKENNLTNSKTWTVPDVVRSCRFDFAHCHTQHMRRRSDLVDRIMAAAGLAEFSEAVTRGETLLITPSNPANHDDHRS